MSDFSDLKAIVGSIIRTNPRGSLQLVELEKQFKQQEGESLKEISLKVGFENITAMIKSWDGFSVVGSGLPTLVQVDKLDHVSEMNQQLKKSSNRPRQQGYAQEENYRRPFCGKDPYAFSSDDLSDQSVESFAQLAVEPKKNRGLVETIDKIIPPCAALKNFDKKLVIKVLDAVNPHRFWFASYEELKEVDKLMTQMAKLYLERGAELKIPNEKVIKGLYVAAAFNEVWHRATIVSVLPLGKFLVFYVDFGTIQVITIDSIRFLMENFMEVPAGARRGVLSHVQPLEGEKWKKQAILFFKKTLDNRMVEAKVLKTNEFDSSYTMAIMVKFDERKQLMSQMMIDKDFAECDSQFLEKEKVNENEMEFSEYENGKHLKIVEPEDIWLPSPKAKEKTIPQEETLSWLPSAKTSPSKTICKVNETSGEKSTTSENLVDSSTGSRISASEREWVNNSFHKHANQQLRRKRLELPSSVKTASKDSVESFQDRVCIVKHNLSAIEQQAAINETLQVYIHSVVNADKFYFFWIDELAEIRQYLSKFNEDYEEHSTLSNTLSLGTDVVVITDENFCRARIIEVMEGETFKVFLVDFGATVVRSKTEIFKLRDEWKKRQGAVYEGKLSNTPEHLHFQVPGALAEAVKAKVVEIKVSLIRDNVLEVLLFD